MGQYELVLVSVGLRIESFLIGHRCGASHRVFDNKVSKWISNNKENLLVRVRMSRICEPLLGFCRSIYIGFV